MFSSVHFIIYSYIDYCVVSYILSCIRGKRDDSLWALDLVIGFIGRLYCNYT
jgi:hypothetical protein